MVLISYRPYVSFLHTHTQYELFTENSFFVLMDINVLFDNSVF